VPPAPIAPADYGQEERCGDNDPSPTHPLTSVIKARIERKSGGASPVRRARIASRPLPTTRRHPPKQAVFLVADREGPWFQRTPPP